MALMPQHVRIRIGLKNVKNEIEAYSEDCLYEEQFDSLVWETVEPQDLWVFDKLIVARMAGHICGPRGSAVPVPGNYFVRPVINTFGMGLMARIEYISGFAEDMHPAEFWSEIFTGKHLSVDYEFGEQILCVEGERHKTIPFQRFTRWEKSSEKIPLPSFLNHVARKYRFLNCEFINGKLIEVHLRRNPDFRWGNSVMIPKWRDEPIPGCTEEMRYFPDQPNCPDGREGVFIA